MGDSVAGGFFGLIRDVVARCWDNVFSKWGMALICLASLALRLNPLDWMGRARLEGLSGFANAHGEALVCFAIFFGVMLAVRFAKDRWQRYADAQAFNGRMKGLTLAELQVVCNAFNNAGKWRLSSACAALEALCDKGIITAAKESGTFSEIEVLLTQEALDYINKHPTLFKERSVAPEAQDESLPFFDVD